MWRVISLGLALLLSFTGAVAAQESIELSGLSWSARGDWKLGEHLGRQAVVMRNAVLDLEDVIFADGTIEFDVAVAGHRSFMGVAFRLQEGGSYEDFYLRPHQSGRFDALQYTPVWHNASAWQLYPEHNARFDIPRDEWLHVKLVIRDQRLEAYLGGSEKAALVVERLRGPEARGGLALRSFFPAAREAPDFFPNAFSNFRYTPDGSYRNVALEIEAIDSRVISRWALSQTFAGRSEAVEAYPTDLIAETEWTEIPSEPSGRTNLAIPEGIPEGEDLGLKLARVVLTSDADRRVKLNYGFSDRASIFLNGRLIFTGNNTYRSRSERYLGVMTLDNDAVYLDLEEGDNELLFAVTEAFGGWGLTARLGDLEGLAWHPSPSPRGAH